jgi:hypothetical protein
MNKRIPKNHFGNKIKGLKTELFYKTSHNLIITDNSLNLEKCSICTQSISQEMMAARRSDTCLKSQLLVRLRISNSRPAWEKLGRSCLKNKIQTEGLRALYQVVERLPSMCKVSWVQSPVLGRKRKEGSGGSCL